MPPPIDLDRLADELTPVRRIGPASGAAAAGLAFGAFALAVVLVVGIRPDLAQGRIQPMFLIRAGLLLLLGSASLAGVLGMARPAVGSQRTGWHWAVAAAAVLPVAAIVLALTATVPIAPRLHMVSGAECLAVTLGGGLTIGAALTVWLRRGAPTSPERAGLLVGLASGSFAALAYGLHCPHDDMVYIGLWYTIAVGVAAGLGRLIVPPLIRW